MLGASELQGILKRREFRQRMLGCKGFKAGAQVAGSGKGQGATVAGVKSGSGVEHGVKSEG